MSLLSGVGADDDAALLGEDELSAEEDQAVATATLAGASGAGEDWPAQIGAELAAVAEMRQIAEGSRADPDARIRHLIDWIGSEMVPGLGRGGQAWSERRLLIFTEYEDTRRWIERLLREAIADTEDAEARIAVFTGATPPDRREEIKRAFNAAPADDPLRILVATDAAREGLNLQRHCRDLFHLDLPWNPSRLEQRNGRIDRKLQPASRVHCRYFIYAQRPEDRVLRRLVEKTEIIRRQLGSASPVIESRISELLAGGIERQRADRIAAEIDRIEQSDAERRAHDDLEPVRESDAALARRLGQLRSQLQRSQDRVGVDREQLERVVTYGLRLAGAPPLHRTAPEDGPARFAFDPDEITGVKDAGLAPHPRRVARLTDPLGAGPLRPVSFDPPPDHRRRNGAAASRTSARRAADRPLLEPGARPSRAVPRLSRRRTRRGVPDRAARPLLGHCLGRLSLSGGGAAACTRRSCVSRRARSSHRSAAPRCSPTIAMPNGRRWRHSTARSMRRGALRVAPGVRDRLLAGLARDVAELLPELQRRAEAAAATAKAAARPARRGRGGFTTRY